MQTEQLAGCAVLITVAVFTIRWIFSADKSSHTNVRNLGASESAHPVNSEQVNMIKTVFPNIESVAIAYDLQKTGSADATIENAISSQNLPLPPRGSALYTRFPLSPGSDLSTHTSAADSANRNQVAQTEEGRNVQGNASTSGASKSLIDKYGLSSRLNDSDMSTSSSSSNNVAVSVHRQRFPNSKKEREELFRRRKEEMIIAARKRMEEKMMVDNDS
ncbi:CUE domain-containing protein Cue1/4 family protein [Schizosaccharomyces cryophilus OY26]|uniref:CUE domain-containing protein Cue1/4 family protein n=1 Tax=Schizosaccharomyces cryophilus (strain OY26 / ATCC MYA-4695 / CBS 11777 / NBRC 106824 / NRRL Y48691) TaxID=653667 RepID=S9VPU6_SCHCR|nr:CUE domain-containing protein Cue1/4 family protein [Schizosaccharomyces cryophilus OY26]EPY49968.1 CUE domain-containing protein Cue1/4 family protein [Schizosaccharomyces cryophilus OY26]